MTETPGSATHLNETRTDSEAGEGSAATWRSRRWLITSTSSWLREAYRRTRKDGATGVDGQSAEQYAAQLEDNLRSLLERAKSGTYRAPPEMRAVLPAPGSTK